MPLRITISGPFILEDLAHVTGSTAVEVAAYPRLDHLPDPSAFIESARRSELVIIAPFGSNLDAFFSAHAGDRAFQQLFATTGQRRVLWSFDGHRHAEAEARWLPLFHRIYVAHSGHRAHLAQAETAWLPCCYVQHGIDELAKLASRPSPQERDLVFGYRPWPSDRNALVEEIRLRLERRRLSFELASFRAGAAYTQALLGSRVCLNVSLAGDLNVRNFEVWGLNRVLLSDRTRDHGSVRFDPAHTFFFDRDLKDFDEALDRALEHRPARIDSARDVLEHHMLIHRYVAIVNRELGLELAVASQAVAGARPAVVSADPVAPAAAAASPATPPPPVAPTRTLRLSTPVPAVSVGPPRPRISVLTATLNCARFLPAAIESVRAQGYPEVEHIVADGGSTDGTVDILRAHPHLRWISEKDSGEGQALNRALRMATGDIIVCLGGDDLFEPGAFEQVATIVGPEAGRHLVCGRAVEIDETGDCVGMRVPAFPITLGRLLRSFDDLNLFQPAVFFSRALIEAVGPFREDLLYFSVDLEYWLRAASKGYAFHYVDQPLAQTRLIGTGAKARVSWADLERNWSEVGRAFVPELSPPEQIAFWKDYYLFRLRSKARFGDEPVVPPSERHALHGFALALYQQGDFDRLLHLLEQALELHPSAPELYWLAAEMVRRAGHIDDARRMAATARSLETSPGPRYPGPPPHNVPRPGVPSFRSFRATRPPFGGS